ncbi:MAG: hypothetical protein HYT22_01330 [Candidatus Niyogibacteria bacterium]|nr:hypothetical protein [Candidatus Niyogibacteria bacterium]
MQKLQSKDFYRTADLALAAALSLFVPLEAIDKTDYRRAYFVFPHSEELDELVAAFWRKELKVEPQAYFDELRAIKTRLYAQN